MALPIEDEKQLSIGGFQGIKKLRGLLIRIDVVDPPESWENREKQVVKVDTEDAVVLEMFGDEEPFELKDGKFSFFVPYVAIGKSPHQNSVYSRCWLASAKELGKVPSEFIGEHVTFEKQPRLLFSAYVTEDDGTGKKVAVRDENGDKIKQDILAVNEAGLPNHFCFTQDEGADSENIKDYIRNLVEGLNEKATLRKLLTDPKAKQYPNYKAALNGGTLGELLDLVLVDGKFTKEQDEVSSS